MRPTIKIGVFIVLALLLILSGSTVVAPADAASPSRVVANGTIVVTKYLDKNNDGIFNGNDSALEGWTIRLRRGNNTIATLTTGSDGKVTFSDVTPRDYKVCEVLQEGWRNTDDPDDTSSSGSMICKEVEVEAGETVNVSFGNRRNVSPIRECVLEVEPNTYWAYFGWENYNTHNTGFYIPYNSGVNKVTPNSYQGQQPNYFFHPNVVPGRPGRTGFWTDPAWIAQFTGNTTITWSLDGSTATANKNSPPCAWHVYIEKKWIDANGVEIDPPDNLSPDYQITATSDLGTATCQYNDDMELECEYMNDLPNSVQSLDNRGLWVSANGTFDVTETELPAGWETESGVGEGFSGNTDVCGEDGGFDIKKSCLHTLINRQEPPPPTGKLTIYKYEDADQSGNRSEVEELLEGWEFIVYDEDNNEVTDGVTDENGMWMVELPIGTYTVCEVLQNGWENTDPGNDSACKGITISSGLSSPGPLSATVTLATTPNPSTYKITFVGRTGNTWSYFVEEISGKDLSHWDLGIENCLDHVVSYSPAGADLGTDGSTGFVGIKWDVGGGFNSGTFSFTLDSDYPAGTVEVLFKASTQSNTGLIIGPDCVEQETAELYFGNYELPLGTLKIFKFNDEDRSGTFNEETEEGLEGWAFTVKQDSNTVESGNTDADGYLEFELLAGEYEVCETLQTGWGNQTPLCQIVVIESDQTTSVSFANYLLRGTLSILKYNDGNRNQTKDGNEGGLNDWTFTVKQGEQTIESGVTANGGTLNFSLLPGDYEVCETLKTGWNNTTPLCQTVNIVAEQTTPVQFGNYQPSLRAVLECVRTTQDSTTSYALYGYNNTDTINLNQPVGSGNKFTPTPEDRGQPTTFLPGRQVGVFWVEFTGGNLVWSLKHPVTGIGNTATAAFGLNTCGDRTPLGSIDVFKFYDANNDGEAGEGEDGLGGWTFTVKKDGATVKSGVTGEGGNKLFELLPGTYEVCETLQDGWTNTTDLCQTVTIETAGQHFELEFGNVDFGTLNIFKFNDSDRNTEQNGNEAGLNDWEFTVKQDDTGVESGVTADGGYLSFRLTPGSYEVCETLKTGWNNTTPLCQTVEITGGQTSELKFGNYQPRLGPVLECVRTTRDGTTSYALFGYNNTDTVNLNVAVSSANNKFNPAPENRGQPTTFSPGRQVGVFWVEFTAGNLVWTLKHPVTGLGGTSTAAFGLNTCGDRTPLGLLDIFKFNDLNGNGSKNNGEGGLGGWEFTVSQNNQVIKTGTTDSNGNLGFDLLPGTYRVCETLQSGWLNSTPLCRNVTITVGATSKVNFGNVVYNPPPRGTCYAQEVVEYVPGTTKAGGAIHPDRDDPTKALGAAQDNDTLNFVSLGFGGEDLGRLILSFEPDVILNVPGPDFIVFETSYGDRLKPWENYPEQARVFASQDGVIWVDLGIARKDTTFDLGALPWARYIKLVDETDPSKFGNSNDVDGFDVDAVEAFSCVELATIVVKKEADAESTFNFTGDLGEFSLATGESTEPFEVLPGDYSVSETEDTNWTLESATCDNGDEAGDITVEAGDEITCTFVNAIKPGYIIIKKEADAEGTFSFTGDLGDFELGTGESTDAIEVTPGDYSVSETENADWTLESATCDDQSAPDAISVQPNETVTCTFVNAIKPGYIIIKKEADAEGTFSFTGDLGDFELGTGESTDAIEVTPGNYSVSETENADWTLESATCDDQSAPDAISVQPNETVTCTFVNAIKPGYIIIKKEADAEGTFSFTGDLGDFELGTGESTDAIEVTPGDYNVSETEDDEWTLISATCDDESAPDAISVQPNETVTCTFVNQLKLGGLTVLKFNDGDRNAQQNGNEGGLNGWTFTVKQDDVEIESGVTANGGTVNFDLQPGFYEVCETLQSGWNNTTPLCQTVEIVVDETVMLKFGNYQPRLSPVLECVRTTSDGTRSYALFGYNNTDSVNLNVAVSSANNKFNPAPEDRGQPTTFIPGRQVGVFWVEFTAGNLVWTLKHPVTNLGGTSTAAFGLNTCGDRTPLGTLEVLKFNDLNRNGNHDENEPPLPNWTFTVGNIVKVTDGNGIATFELLPNGYQVCETLQDGWQPSTSLCQAAMVYAGQKTTLKVGNYEETYTVRVTKVWQDYLGQTVNPPAGLENFSITVTNETTNDSITCAYDNGTLVCDPASLTLKVGETYSVSETGVPAGWSAISGIGQGFSCETESCVHTVTNKQDSPIYHVVFKKRWIDEQNRPAFPYYNARYSIVATNNVTGDTVTCAYRGQVPTCTPANSLPVRPGETYSVYEYDIPAGWQVISGVGDSFTCNNSTCMHIVTNQKQPEQAVCPQPDPKRDLKAVIVPGSNPNEWIGIVTNSSPDCTYDVGMASYKKYDSTLSTQELVSSDEAYQIGYGETRLVVEAPACAAQLDVYFDASHLYPLYHGSETEANMPPLTLPAFNTGAYGPLGNMYGMRLLAAKHINGTRYCEPEEFQCNITDFTVTGIEEVSEEDETYYIEVELGNNVPPAEVYFELTGPDGFEMDYSALSAPYTFMGLTGWDITDYAPGEYTLKITIYQNDLPCLTKEYIIVIPEETIPQCILALNGVPQPEAGMPNTWTTPWNSQMQGDVIYVGLAGIEAPVKYNWELTFPTDWSNTVGPFTGSGEFTDDGIYQIVIPYPPLGTWGMPGIEGNGTYESHVTLWIDEPCRDQDWDHWYQADFETDLSLDKSGPAEVTEGDEITYIITVTNNGPWNAQVFEGRGTLITDMLPAGVSFVSATWVNGAANGTCDYLEGEIACDIGELKYQTSATITIKVTADEPGVLENTASVEAERPVDSNPNNNHDSVETLVKGVELDEETISVIENTCQDNSAYDSVGDPCNHDEDNDGIPDDGDVCPLDATHDSYGDPCNHDEDGDGIPDDGDVCPLDATHDSYGDPCNHDEDGDGTPDDGDVCPMDATHDSVGDPCNHNEDGDLLDDFTDVCPLDYAETSDGCVIVEPTGDVPPTE